MREDMIYAVVRHCNSSGLALGRTVPYTAVHTGAEECAVQ